jgi:hypothetical protein
MAEFRISIGLNADPDPDPAIYHNADPDPGFALTLEVKNSNFFFPFFLQLIFFSLLIIQSNFLIILWRPYPVSDPEEPKKSMRIPYTKLWMLMH